MRTVVRVIQGFVADVRAVLRVYRGGAPPGSGGGRTSRVAVVMGAQVLPGGRASRTLAARTRHAARLYRLGLVDLVVPTGGLGEHPPVEAALMAGMLREGGVPDAAVLREDRALSTWDSAWLVAGLARKRGIASVRVVTDPLHCVRTVAAFREAGLDAGGEPVYSSPMWRERRSRRGQLIREIGACGWYRVVHRVGSRSRP